MLSTRKAKRDGGKNLEDLQDPWRIEAFEKKVDSLVLGEPMPIQRALDGAVYEVDSAIRHLSENSVSFSRDEIYAYALKHIHAEGLSVELLSEAIARRKDLIPVQKGRLTTVDALEREIKTRNLWMAGQGQAQPFMDMAAAQAAMDLASVQAALVGKSLKSGQVNAVLRTLTSKDMHQVWHGRSGVGKSTALKELVKQLEGTGVALRGYAPKTETAEELEKDLGIQTNTVQHLVLAKPDMAKNQLWLVDEAGLIGAEDMLKMQLKAEAVGARILLVGDTKQNSSIKAGSPMRSLMQNGATTYKIHEIIRQQNETQKEAVELIADGNGLAALKLLVEKNYVSEIGDRDLRAHSVADQYIALSKKERDKTLILTGTNAERLRITAALREKLHQEGSLGESIKTVQLVSRQFTPEESRRIENYAVGDYVRFRRDYPGSELKSGRLYKIEKKHGHELIVSSPGGRKYRFDPEKQKDKDVYYAQNIQIAVGDKLRWTVKDKEKGLANGRRFAVAAIGETTMTIKDAKTRKTQEVSLMEPLALDYNWVVTSYKGQGGTITRSLVSITNDPTASQESTYVNISRQIEELQIFAENVDDLQTWVQRSNAQDNALDLIEEQYGKPTATADSGTTREGLDREPRATEAKSRLISPNEPHSENDPNLGKAGNGAFLDPVHQSNGGQETHSNSRNAEATRGHSQGVEPTTALENAQPGAEENILDQLVLPLDNPSTIPQEITGAEHGNSTEHRSEAGLNSEAHGSASVSKSGATESEHRDEEPVEQRHEYGTARSQRRDAGVHSSVQGGTGQSKTIGDGRVNQAPGQSHGSPRSQTRQLGANSRTGGLVSGDGSRGDQGLQASAAQQRFSEAHETPDLKNSAPVVSPRYVGLDDLAQTDRTIQDAQSLFDRQILERLGHLIDRLKQSSAQTPKPVYEGMAHLVQGDRSESEERLLLDSGVLDGLEALGQKLDEGLPQSVTPKFEGLGDLARMERDEQDAQQLLDSAIWERLSHLADRLEPSTAIEQAQGYKNLGDIVQGDAIEPEIQLILESGLLERLESLSQTLTEQIASAQASAYEGMNEHVQLNQREPDERLLIENRVIERLEYLAQRLDEAQTHITAQSYEGLGELIAMETHNKDVRLVLESEIIDRLKTLTNQIESRTGVQNDQINSLSQNPSASTRAIERDRPDPSIADLDLVAQPESRRNREGVTAAAPGIDDRATEISRGIAERLSGAIITGDVAEAIRELARSCGEIDADYERVRATHEGRAGLESALSQLAQSVHRLDEQLGQALRRERVNAVAGAIAEWRSEQQLGQSIAQFSGIIQSLGVDVTQPSEIAHDLAQAIGQNNVETELEAALVSLSVMFEQTQAQVMARPDIQKLSQTITDLQAEQALIEAVSQFNALIESTKPTPQRSAAEVLAQSINNVWIEDERTEALTQLNEAIAQAHAPVSPTVTLADAWSVSIATRNLETELTESLELLAELLSQTPAQHRRAPEVQQLAALIDEWRAEGDLTQAIAQFSTLMQSVSEASVTAEDLADQIVQSNVEAEIAQTTARFNEAVQQAMEPLRSRPEVIEMVNAIESLQLADLESDIAQSVERLAAQIHTLGIDRQPNPQATELAQRLLDRRAEDVLNEHLAAFNDATVAVLAELRQRPELAQLVEVVQMLRSDPTLSEGATGQQIRELTQGVQKLIPESAMPTGGDRPSLTPKPKKPEVFWVPDYSTAERPDHIEARHWQEMTKSAIHPELIALNFTSLEGEAVHDRLLSEKLATMGTGQYVTAPMARLMAQYETLTEGGWWGTAGIDAKSLINLQPGQQPHLSTWGCFKGDNPRIDQDKTERKGETEFIKYENPAGTERHLYLPIVSEDMAQKIYDMHGIQPTAAERENGFWSVVANHPEIPIAITEGLKKTLASLSQGKVTLGLAGVNGLYRARDEDKQKLPERLLNDEVAIFAAPGRSFTFAFDRDSKTSTAFNVRRELVRGVERLEDIGCHCKIAKWKPADGKGLDDLIVNQGAQAYTSAIATAQPSDQEKRTYYRTEYNAISRQVKKTQHDITNDALDIEVYLRAIAKGEPKDGERFISHSDQARSLKDPAQVTAYIEQVKAAAPQYLQQQRELEAEQAQRAADRAEYETLAARVRKTPVQLSSEVVDMQVYLIAEQEGSPGDGDRLIAQSNHARTLNDKQAVSSYVEYIKTEASSYVQRVREQIERTNDRRRYEDLVAQVRQENADIPTAHINREVYLKAEAKGLNSEVILAQSDQARTLNDPAQVQDYVERIIVEAQQYQQQQQVIAAAEAQRVADRGVYVAIAQQVETELGDIPAERVDMEIYLRAGASGADRILAQSDQAIALNDPAQVQDYIERIKAEAPLYRQQQQQLEAAQAEAEARLVHEQSIYQAIAQGAREVDSTFSIETIDRFVWIAAQQFGVEPERLLAHSERVRSNPEQAQTYIQRIKVDAAQYQQQKADAAAQEAQAPMQPEPKVEKPSEQVKPVSAAIATPQKAQQRVDQTVASIKRGLRDEYDAYAKQIVEKLGNVPPEVLDMEIYLSAGRSDHAKRLIQVGDNMVALRKNSSDFEGFYCDAIARVAPAYEEIKNDPDAKLNYKMMAAIVTNTNAKLLVESRPEPTIYRKKEREDELML